MKGPTIKVIWSDNYLKWYIITHGTMFHYDRFFENRAAPMAGFGADVLASTDRLPRLNLGINSALAQRLLDTQFNRVLADNLIAFGDDDDIAADIGSFLG